MNAAWELFFNNPCSCDCYCYMEKFSFRFSVAYQETNALLRLQSCEQFPRGWREYCIFLFIFFHNYCDTWRLQTAYRGFVTSALSHWVNSWIQDGSFLWQRWWVCTRLSRKVISSIDCNHTQVAHGASPRPLAGPCGHMRALGSPQKSGYWDQNGQESWLWQESATSYRKTHFVHFSVMWRH